MLVLLRFVFGSAGASGSLGLSVDFRRAALARASSAVLRVCHGWSCPPISPNSLASVLSCCATTCVAAPAMPHLRCHMRAALCGSNFLAVSTTDTGFPISTKGVSRAGGYARAPAACAPSCVCALPRTRACACARTRARWRPAAIAGHPAAARAGSPVCSTWLVPRFRARRPLHGDDLIRVCGELGVQWRRLFGLESWGERPQA